MVKILKIMDTNFTSQGLNGRVESIHNGLILVSCISSSMAHGEESFTKLPALSNSETFIRIYWMVNEGRGMIHQPGHILEKAINMVLD